MTDIDKNIEKIIEVQNLKKSFDGKIILNNISLHLIKGENLVVIGKSGSGKSVLNKCIVRLIEPDAGSIKVFGTEMVGLKDSKLNRIRKQIGYLFQGGALYDYMSIEENLLFTLERNRNYVELESAKDLINEVLESVGLEDAKGKMPSELSGGMQKRAGLARTLILKPGIILYDEPTTGLDPFTAEEISELIVDIQKLYNTSSIIVTHDMKCAKIAGNRILVMDEGKFSVEGSYKDLIEKNKLQKLKKFFH